MIIIKPFAVILHNGKYLVAKDHGETFFKNVGGRILDEDTDVDCLRRNLLSELRLTLTVEPKLLFELEPTPAVGDPGHQVILKAYLVEDVDIETLVPGGDTVEIAWVNQDSSEYDLTPQITELILPKLAELNLI